MPSSVPEKLWRGTPHLSGKEYFIWNTKHSQYPRSTPVVIFLSDGEGRLTDANVYDLCQAAVRQG
jgi:hypothetical protein